MPCEKKRIAGSGFSLPHCPRGARFVVFEFSLTISVQGNRKQRFVSRTSTDVDNVGKE